MRAVAREVGLDLDRWNEDFAGDEVATAFFTVAARAEGAGVNSTPTFVVRGPAGEQTITGAAEIGAFEQAIRQVGST